METKCQIETTAKIRLYEVLQRAVDDGIAYGWNRAHKHTDTPAEHLIRGEIYNAVMNSLCDVIDFD